MLPLPELQETPETHVGHSAEGTVEGTHIFITIQRQRNATKYIIISIYVKYNENNNKY